MSASSPPEATLETLEKQLAELTAVKVFDNSVRDGVSRIVAAMPSPDDEKDTDRKVRLLLLRCKATLLLPLASKEAEKDLHMALKLKQGSAETWVLLSECFLRRNAFKEACDALDNALRIEPGNVAALCKYSQVQRNRCGQSGITSEQKTEFLHDAVAKAREAVHADMHDADTWNTFSLSLLSLATAEGITFAGAQKAMTAMKQAALKTSSDPDIHFNKAVLESLSGRFGDAVTDFVRAHELDSTRLKGTRQLTRANADVLHRAVTRMKNTTGIGRRDFQRTQANLKNVVAKARKASPALGHTHVAVVDIVTEASMQPQALLAVDEQDQFCLVLVYGVSGASFKIGDVTSFPSSTTKQMEVEHRVLAAPQLDVEAVDLTIRHFYPDANQILLNERSMPPVSRVPLQLSSRLFA